MERQMDDVARLRETMAAHEAEHKSFRRRLDALEDATRRQSDILLTLQRQGDAIENMTQALRELKQAVEKVNTRVGDLEREPADKWKKVTLEIIKYIVTAGIGAAIACLLK